MSKPRMASKPDINDQGSAAYAVLPDLKNAMKRVSDALAARATCDRAVEQNIAEAKAAEESYQEACNAMATAEADLALSLTEQEDTERQKIADAATTAAEIKLRALEQKRRIGEALCARAADVDGQIAEAKATFSTELSLFVGAAMETYASELNEAIKPLVALIYRGIALHNATRSRQLGTFLTAIQLPDPLDNSGRYPLIDSRLAKIDGATVDMLVAWKGDPAAHAIFEELSSISETESKISAHTVFVHPRVRPRPYVRRGYTMEGKGADDAPFGSRSAEPDSGESKPGSARPANPQELNIGGVLANGLQPADGNGHGGADCNGGKS